MTNQMSIPAFDPSTMKPDATVMMIGRRGSGKSTLISDVMYNMRDQFSFGLAMSPTEDSSASLGEFLPRACIYNEFSDSAIGQMLRYQRANVDVKNHRFRNMFLIMDDCGFDNKSLKSKNMREVFMNGRHRKMFIVYAVQYLMDIPSALRGQIDYVFVTHDNMISNREKLWKYFFGMFNDYKDFSKVMDTCTDGRNCIVLNTTVRSNRPEDCVSWYCASPDLPRFRTCDDIFWRLDARYHTTDQTAAVVPADAPLVVRRKKKRSRVTSSRSANT